MRNDTRINFNRIAYLLLAAAAPAAIGREVGAKKGSSLNDQIVCGIRTFRILFCFIVVYRILLFSLPATNSVHAAIVNHFCIGISCAAGAKGK